MYGLPVGKHLPGCRTESAGHELLPYVVNGLFAGMQHVGGVEAVVAQLVVQNLVGGKVVQWRVAELRRRQGGVGVSHELVDGQQQRGL